MLNIIVATDINIIYEKYNIINKNNNYYNVNKNNINDIINDLECPNLFNILEYDLSYYLIQEDVSNTLFSNLLNLLKNKNDIIFISPKFITFLDDIYFEYQITNEVTDTFEILSMYVMNNSISISKEDLTYLINMLNDDFYLASNELKKISLLNLNISRDMIDNNVSSLEQNSIFLLLEYLILDKKNAAFNLFNSLLDNNTSLVSIIEFLNSNLRIYYSVKLLSSSMNRREIATILGLNSYRLNRMLILLDNVSLLSLQNLYLNLGTIERTLKNSSVNNNIINILFF